MRARDNPFRAERLHRLRFRPQGASWAELESRFERLGRRAAIVGPEGRGKTTLLEELAVRLAGQGLRPRWVRLAHRQRGLDRSQRAAVRALDAGDLLCVDGAQELGRMAWLDLRRRSRRADGLLVTSHRTGLLPTLHECRTSPELLALLVRDLDPEGARAVPPPDALFARHRGDLRAALRELYDRYAEG